MSRGRAPQKPYKLGFFGTISMAAAVLIFMYATTFAGESLDVMQSAILMLITGVLLAFITVGLRFEPFNFKHFMTSLLSAGICVIVIYIVQVTAPFTMETQVIPSQLFAVLMGVSEECFFRLWLCTFVKKITGSSFFGIFISAFTWTVYHIARYGANMATLWIILFAGVALGIVVVETKMGDGAIFAHALVNFLATSGG